MSTFTVSETECSLFAHHQHHAWPYLQFHHRYYVLERTLQTRKTKSLLRRQELITNANLARTADEYKKYNTA